MGRGEGRWAQLYAPVGVTSDHARATHVTGEARGEVKPRMLCAFGDMGLPEQIFVNVQDTVGVSGNQSSDAEQPSRFEMARGRVTRPTLQGREG